MEKHENSCFQPHWMVLNLRYNKRNPPLPKQMSCKEEVEQERSNSVVAYTGNGPHNKDMPFDSDWVHPFADGACASVMKAQKNLMDMSIAKKKRLFALADCIGLTRPSIKARSRCKTAELNSKAFH